jgi:hypothetical protein
MHRVTPATQLTWVGPEVGEWARHLRGLGIEPDLSSVPEQISEFTGDDAPRNPNRRLALPESLMAPKTTPFYLSETFPVPEEG